MAVSRKKKNEVLDMLIKRFEESEGVAMYTSSELTVSESEEFRRDARKAGVHVHIAKKTLIALAASKANKATFKPDDLDGAITILFHKDDVVLPAFKVSELVKKTYDKLTKKGKVHFAGAVMNGKLLSKQETEALANTPTKLISLSKIVSTLKSGPQKLHTVLRSGLQSQYTILSQADKYAK